MAPPCKKAGSEQETGDLSTPHEFLMFQSPSQIYLEAIYPMQFRADPRWNDLHPCNASDVHLHEGVSAQLQAQKPAPRDTMGLFSSPSEKLSHQLTYPWMCQDVSPLLLTAIIQVIFFFLRFDNVLQ